MFGSDDDEEADRLAELRIEAAARKHAENLAAKGKKKKVDKTLMVIEMNPADDTTDLNDLEAQIREKITPETLKGMLHWGVEAKQEDIRLGRGDGFGKAARASPARENVQSSSESVLS